MLIKQIKINFVFKIISQLIPLLSSVIIARVAGADVLGVLSLATAIVMMIDTFFNSGVGSANVFYLNKGISPEKGNGAMLFINFFLKLLILTFVILVSYITYKSELIDKELYTVLIIFSGSSLFLSFFQIPKSYFNAIVDQKNANLPSFWQQLVSHTSKSIIAVYIPSAIPIALAIFFSNLITSPIAIVGFFRKTNFTIPDFGLIKIYLKKALSFLSFTATKVIPQFLDKIILGLIVGTYMVGIYTVAQRAGGAIESIAIAISMVLFPVFAKAVNENKVEKIQNIVSRFYIVFLVFIVPGFLFISFNSRFILELIFGSEFGQGDFLMKIFIGNALLTIFLMPFTNILIGFNSMRAANTINIISFVVFLSFPIILVFFPQLDEISKAILIGVGRIMGNLVAVGLYYLKTIQLVNLKNVRKDFHSIFGILILYVFSLFLQIHLNLYFNHFIAAFICSTAYLLSTVLYLGTRGYKIKDISQLILKG